MTVPIPLAETSIKALVYQTIKTARSRCWNAAIVGAAGVGKTRAIAAYTESHPGTGLLTASDALGRAPRDLWSQISNELVGSSGGTTAQIQHDLFAYDFKNVALIIDEAQNLPPAQLREILHLNDRAKLTIIYCGNWEVLKRANTRKGAWEQIVSRIDPLFEVVDGILDEDADAIASAFGVSDACAFPLLRGIGQKHHARGIVHVLEVARDRAGVGKTINAAHVREAIALFPQYRTAVTVKAAAA